jgi:holo-[acyl-carrier protein] synthase
MIVGLGIDITEVSRIRAAIERHGQRFLQRVFTPAEIRYCDSKKNRYERYAARFAAKEATMKAIGTGWRLGVAWKDIEVGREPGGRPTLHLTGQVKQHADYLGMHHASLSLTHTETSAMAQVILED